MLWQASHWLDNVNTLDDMDHGKYFLCSGRIHIDFPMALYNISRELVLINNLIMLVNMDMVRLPMSLFSLSTCYSMSLVFKCSLLMCLDDFPCKSCRKLLLTVTCRGTPWCPCRSTPSSSSGWRARPQVWHKYQNATINRHLLVLVSGL